MYVRTAIHCLRDVVRRWLPLFLCLDEVKAELFEVALLEVRNSILSLDVLREEVSN